MCEMMAGRTDWRTGSPVVDATEVGLSALVHLLSEFEDLQPVYITVLLSQPSADRQRLLRPAGDEGALPTDAVATRRTARADMETVMTMMKMTRDGGSRWVRRRSSQSSSPSFPSAAIIVSLPSSVFVGHARWPSFSASPPIPCVSALIVNFFVTILTGICHGQRRTVTLS